MNSNGPFWRSKLAVRTYITYQLILLSLGYIAILLLNFQGDVSIFVLKSMMAFMIIILTNYLYNLFDLLFVKKIKNKIVLSKAVDNKLFINSLLIIIFLPLEIIIWVIPVIIFSRIITAFVNKKIKTGMIDDAILSLVTLMIISLVLNQNLALFMIDLSIATSLGWIAMAMGLVLVVTKIIKKRIINFLIISIPIIIGIVFLLTDSPIMQGVNYLLTTGVPLFTIYYLLNPENTPTRKLAISIVMTIIAITMLVGLVLNIKFILLILLFELLVIKAIRDSLDFIGLKK